MVYCRFNKCMVRGDEKPSWSDNVLNGYYLVLTSGTKSGCVYPIAPSSDGVLKANDTDPATNFKRLTVRYGTYDANPGTEIVRGIRAGDWFAIIGSKTGSCANGFPMAGFKIGSVSHIAFLNVGSSNRTIRVATHGSSPRDGAIPWEYSYGCIISPPTPEMRNTYRVDVLVYRGFNPSSTLEHQERPAGHYVTYISRLDDYASP